MQAIAKVKGLKGCGKMCKGELTELLDATSPNGFNLSNLSRKEMWVIAEARDIKGYKKMSRSKLIEIFSPDVDHDDSQSVKALRAIAKRYCFKGNYKLLLRII